MNESPMMAASVVIIGDVIILSIIKKLKNDPQINSRRKENHLDPEIKRKQDAER